MIRKILEWLSWPGRKIHELLGGLDPIMLFKYEEAVGRIRQLQERVTFLEKARDDAHEQCEVKHKAWKYAEDRAAILEGKLGYIKDIIDNGPLYTELTEIDTPPPPKDSFVEAIENSVADMPDDLPFNDYLDELFTRGKRAKLPDIWVPFTTPYFDRAGAIRDLVGRGYVEHTCTGLTDEQLKKLL